jgi:hypothetical protein
MRISPTVALLALSGAVALAGCGEPKAKDAPATGATAKPLEAVQEIDVVRKDLVRVVNEVQQGHRKAAGEIVSETYVQHFEKVEPPLDKADHKLKEKLEKALSRTLRQKIKTGKPVGEIGKFVQRLDLELAKAQDELKRQ